MRGAGQDEKDPEKQDETQVKVCGLEPTERRARWRLAVRTQQPPRMGGRLGNIIFQDLLHQQQTANRGLRAAPGSDKFCSACALFSK